jgi:DNA-binding NarL/FixJ family response regulator
VAPPLRGSSECDEASSPDDDSSSATVGHPPSVWRALLEGRLTMVERLDRDGHHHVVVRSTETHPLLSPRERKAVTFARAGYANKRVAIELGVSDATACALFASVLKKLGLRSRLDLVRLFGGSTLGEEPTLAIPEGLELSARHWRGEPCILLTFPARKPEWPPGLTPAERVIGALLMDGVSTAEIARRRRTAERTAANQIASLLRKAGVASRLELASYVFAPRSSRTTPRR